MPDTIPQPTPFFGWWRPTIGWISVIGLINAFVLFPLIGLVAALIGHPIILPIINTESIIAMVTATVGLGGMRTIEKLKGVHNP